MIAEDAASRGWRSSGLARLGWTGHAGVLAALTLSGCDFPVLGLLPDLDDRRDAGVPDGEDRDAEARDAERPDTGCAKLAASCGRYRVVAIPTEDSLITSVAEPYGRAVLVIERTGRVLRVDGAGAAPVVVNRIPDLEAMAALVVGERLWVTGNIRGTTTGAIAAGTVTGTIAVYTPNGLTPLRHLVGRVEEEKYVRLFGVSHPSHGLAPLYAGDFALRGPPQLVPIFGPPFRLDAGVAAPDAGRPPSITQGEGSAWLLDDGTGLLVRTKGGCEPDAPAACLVRARGIDKNVDKELERAGALDRVFADPSGRVLATTVSGQLYARDPDSDPGQWRPHADLSGFGREFDYFFPDGAELAVFHRPSADVVHLRQHRSPCPNLCAPIAMPPGFLADVYRVAPLGDGFVVVGRAPEMGWPTAYHLARE